MKKTNIQKIAQNFQYLLVMICALRGDKNCDMLFAGVTIGQKKNRKAKEKNLSDRKKSSLQENKIS